MKCFFIVLYSQLYKKKSNLLASKSIFENFRTDSCIHLFINFIYSGYVSLNVSHNKKITYAWVKNF